MAIAKQPGVDSVEVSLNRGLAVVYFAPTNRVTVEKIQAAIRSNGFTPQESEVQMGGEIVQRDGAPWLVMPGEFAAYPLLAVPPDTGPFRGLPPDLAPKQRVTIRGTVPPGDARTPGIQVRQLQIAER